MRDLREGERALRPYTEPLLRDHGSLMDLTGKSGEGTDKTARDAQKAALDATNTLGQNKAAKDALDHKQALL